MALSENPETSKDYINKKEDKIIEKQPINFALMFQKILSLRNQIEMYLGILIGVILSSAISEYKVTNTISFGSFDIGFFFLSSVIALIVSPYTYEKLGVEPEAPFIVRLGLFVQQGVFWRTIIGSFKY